MDLLQIKTLQRKIAEYPERISKLQTRQKLIVTPSATEIEPAIKGMDAYLLFLKAGISSYKRLYEEALGDFDKLNACIGNKNKSGEAVSESERISLVQIQQYMATIQNYIKIMDSQIDNGEIVKQKLLLARKQKKAIDVANLLYIIQKGDGYRV